LPFNTHIQKSVLVVTGKFLDLCDNIYVAVPNKTAALRGRTQ